MNNNLKKDNFYLKKKYKEIKELKNEKDKLDRKLIQINENQNLLESKNNSNLLFEKNLIKKIKKMLPNKKKKFFIKLI